MDPEKHLEHYKATRYLRHATDEALTERLDDIATNLWSTGRDGDLTPIRDQTHRATLLGLYIDTLHEQKLRNPADLEFSEAELRARVSAGYVAPKLKRPVDFEPTCLAKFSKRRFIFDAFDKGIIRVAPAQSYQDSSLNPAQKDDELSHHVRTPNEQIVFKMYGLDEHGRAIELHPKPLELFRYMEVPNFYVWCCGLGYDARLFKEFNADAALIVKYIGAFTKRFSDAVRAQLPTAAFESGGIGYYDPYNTRHEQLIPGFSKHLRYRYQNEHRFVWKVENPAELTPFFVELGPLHDIATVLELA